MNPIISHDCQDLIQIFSSCFTATYNTQLAKGTDEPIYLPADPHRPCHTIVFAHGFFSSALHECAHWLIAGEERRKLVDYGYWYVPDGRTAQEQQCFQQVEIKPQALEWILSQACGYRFRLSVDNLGADTFDQESFIQSIYQQVANYCRLGLPARARQFRQALCCFYGTDHTLQPQQFNPLSLP